MDEAVEAERRNAPLRTEIELVHGGLGDAAGLRRSLAESALFLLRSGNDGVLTGVREGATWVEAFTSRAELARFAAARGWGDRPVDYLTVRGDRLLEITRDRDGVPAGLAVDVAGERPLLLPPEEGEPDGRR